MATTEEDIVELTALMRTSDDPFWTRLRELLREKGLDPQTTLLADCFPDDASFEFGLLVTPDRRCIQFGFDYLHKSVGEVLFSEWEDLTDRYRATPYDQQFFCGSRYDRNLAWRFRPIAEYQLSLALGGTEMSQLTREQKRRLMYIELKSGHGDSGPARIGWVTFSKTGRSIYYGGKRFERLKGRGVSGNYFDVETREEYWISGIKKRGTNRHWAGRGPVDIDPDAREEYES